MGYSSRYHAASLAAVFLALAIGILIGVGFGDNVLTNTKRDLEASLTGDLEAARDRSDDLGARLAQSEEFAQRVFPLLVSGQLLNRRIGVLALGELPEDVSRAIEDGLRPSGGRLVAVAVVREPPDLGSLAGRLSETRLADLDSEIDSVEALGKGVGRQIVLGGTLLDRVRSQLLSRASGRFGDLDGIVVVRQQPAEMDTQDRVATGRLEEGLLDGIVAAGTTPVGVETTDADPSSISFFASNDLSTVDDLDLVSGQVAMVFALLGAEGNFGVKDTADSLLPDLLSPPPAVP
ncbi:MAG: copper transporter [Solirubrobacterales bacterium]